MEKTKQNTKEYAIEMPNGRRLFNSDPDVLKCGGRSKMHTFLKENWCTWIK